MATFRIRLDANRHAAFLAEQRKDPITKEPLRGGMDIVICANEKIAFMYDNWTGTCPLCRSTDTLRDVPDDNSTLHFGPDVTHTVSNPPFQFGAGAQARPAIPPIIQEPEVPSGISINLKLAIAAVALVLFIWMIGPPRKPATPILTEPSNVSAVRVTVVNNDCQPTDLFFDNQLVASVPGNTSKDAAVLAGQYTTKTCLVGTSRCSANQSVSWKPGTATYTMGRTEQCVAQDTAAERARAEQAARQQQAQEQQLREQQAREQRAQEQQAREQQAQERQQALEQQALERQRIQEQQALERQRVQEQQALEQQQAREQQTSQVVLTINNLNCRQTDFYVDNIYFATVQAQSHYQSTLSAGIHTFRGCTSGSTNECSQQAPFLVRGPFWTFTLGRAPSC